MTIRWDWGGLFVMAALHVIGIVILNRTKRKANGLRAICAAKASPAGGHYSQAVVHGAMVYISGLLPITASGEKLGGRPFAEQVGVVLDNLEVILHEAGSDLQHLVSVRVYIADISRWGEFNEIYAKRLGCHKPARAVVPVPALHFGVQLELEGVAAVVEN
mmetsp:Transcript_54958/g.117955  ORF Transcript_54958/g.117955 Transcript_54958/m.117955 type:complete len:161 (-) Transcript_54958:59-541(-)